MKSMRFLFQAAVIAGAVSLSSMQDASAQQASGKPAYTPDGVVHVPAFDLPPSRYMSPEAVALLKARAAAPVATLKGRTIEDMRAYTEEMLAPTVKSMLARYVVDVEPRVVAGVKTRIFKPKDGEANSNRVLINMHGGAFQTCADACGLLGSMPIAAVGRFKVVSVDYRQGPEHQFPAASEDVATVYKEMLKTYRPENVGIYGCSAGGALTAQVEAWIQDKGLPNPGALGMFGAGATRSPFGDSPYVTAYTEGSFPAPKPDARTIVPMSYFDNVNLDDALVSPLGYPKILAKFPPTLLITGTRAMDQTPVVVTHTELIKAGAQSQLIVGEGMGHCYIYQSDMPEARDAYSIIVRFFDEHLGTKAKR